MVFSFKEGGYNQIEPNPVWIQMAKSLVESRKLNMTLFFAVIISFPNVFVNIIFFTTFIAYGQLTLAQV